ncbi:MAG: hypothetical protein H7A55_12895 [Verrucomicrobiaceae bacterium]|nr:hypothetical protein [Verrucomicrobiaceae bacterium]
MNLKFPILLFTLLAGAAMVVFSSKNSPEEPTQKAGGVESRLPVIADLEPSVEAGADVTVHVISTRSENPFLLEPDAAMQTAKLRTVPAASGGDSLKGGVHGKQIVEATDSLGIQDIQEIRLSAITATGPINPLNGGAVVVSSDESEWFTQYLCADADQKLHLVVVVQLPSVKLDETKR